MAFSKVALAGIAALALGGAIVSSTSSADARPGFRGGNFGGGGFRGFGGGQRFGGFRGGGRGFYGGRGYGRGFGYAGVGIASGLALGAIAASSYPYGYGGYGGYDGYGYGGGYGYGPNCHLESQQVVNEYGAAAIQNVQVCY